MAFTRSENEKGLLTIFLSGRVETSNAAAVEGEVTEALSTDHTALIFDAENLTYISSAGLRILLKAAKSEGAAGHPKVSVLEASRDVYEIFETTGFSEILDVKKAYRKISVEGCKVIGRGFFGTVYRIDDDTIVKVYSTPDAVPMILNEQKMAKTAFLGGIPTAISYDIVKVGDNYGSMFELLQAKTLNDIIIEKPQLLEDTISRYVDLMKLVHSTEIENPDLPSSRDRHLDHLHFIKPYLKEDTWTSLENLLKALPPDNHIVHGDIQMKNVMECKGELMLIDMDTLGRGYPLFDLQGIYVTYILFSEDDPGNSMAFLGIPQETCEKIWEGVFNLYFQDKTEEGKSVILEKIQILAVIRFLFILTSSSLKDNDLGQLRIKHGVEKLDKLVERVKKLSI